MKNRLHIKVPNDGYTVKIEIVYLNRASLLKKKLLNTGKS